MKRLALSAGVLAIAVAGAAAMSATGQESGTTGLKLNGKLSSFHVTDVKPKGNSAGDSFQFTDHVLVGKRAVGHDGGSCVRVDKTYYECVWTIVLKDGSLQMSGQAKDGNTAYTIAIVGGTKNYSGARGEMTVTDAAKTVAHYALTFTVPALQAP